MEISHKISIYFWDTQHCAWALVGAGGCGWALEGVDIWWIFGDVGGGKFVIFFVYIIIFQYFCIFKIEKNDVFLV